MPISEKKAFDAIERGEIAKERHESYLSIYADLVGKRPWKKK